MKILITGGAGFIGSHLADKLLKECILAKTQDEALANILYIGVRFGGGPYFPTWYRWGYGWNYRRSYASLTKEEKEMVKLRLDEYNRKNDNASDTLKGKK